MGLHKDTTTTSNKLTSSSSHAVGKIIPTKASINNRKAKFEKKVQVSELSSRKKILLPMPRLNRRISVDAFTLAALQEPIEEFPLDAIPTEDEHSIATGATAGEEEESWSSIDLATMQSPIMEFDLSSIPGSSSSDADSLLTGWTATWFE